MAKIILILIRPKNQLFHYKNIVHVFIDDELIEGIKSGEIKTIEVKNHSTLYFKVGFVKSNPIYLQDENKEINIDFFMKIKSVKYLYTFITSIFILPFFLLILENRHPFIADFISISLLVLFSLGLLTYIAFLTVFKNKYFKINKKKST
ncbi:MAG: hypothetical protein ABI295_02065 [Xanthomarina sp.]